MVGGEMFEAEVFHIHRKGHFSLEEAQRVVMVIHRVTCQLSKQAEKLMLKLCEPQDKMRLSAGERKKIEMELHGLIQAWQGKLMELGGVPKGLWLVDFDAGDGYFCWKYPE